MTSTPQPGCVTGTQSFALLAGAYIRANRLAPSAADYRSPDDIVLTALSHWTDRNPPEAEASTDKGQRAFALALDSARALNAGNAERAEATAQEALALFQNNLHLQSLLRRARTGGVAEPEAPFAGQFCRAPFENLETLPNGDVHFCCPAWLPVPIGNLNAASADEVWNSQAARDIRASIHDGSYRHCSRQHCPKLANGTLERTEEISNGEVRRLAGSRRVRVERGPRTVILAHDRSCNLACPTCRSALILARKDEQQVLNRLADEVILPLLGDAARVRVTASGDPFGSAHFQYVLRHLDRSGNPDLIVDLQTNGLLLTRRLWDDLALEGRVGALIVSVDAARPETYEIVRRPGRFAVLQTNLDFFAELRRAGRVRHFRLDFVVQAPNFREMPAFVALARGLGCDGVKFQMVRSWGSFTPEEFARHNIGDRQHPEYGAFVAVLASLESSRPFAQFWGMAQALEDAGLGKGELDPADADPPLEEGLGQDDAGLQAPRRAGPGRTSAALGDAG